MKDVTLSQRHVLGGGGSKQHQLIGGKRLRQKLVLAAIAATVEELLSAIAATVEEVPLCLPPIHTIKLPYLPAAAQCNVFTLTTFSFFHSFISLKVDAI